MKNDLLGPVGGLSVSTTAICHAMREVRRAYRAHQREIGACRVSGDELWFMATVALRMAGVPHIPPICSGSSSAGGVTWAAS